MTRNRARGAPGAAGVVDFYAEPIAAGVEDRMQAQKDILDFIVIGAQKAGTTSLFQYLRNHPEIYLPDDKEAAYFSRESVYERRSWTDYMSNLADGNHAVGDPLQKWGTVTPQYMAGGVLLSAPDVAAQPSYDEQTVPLRIRERLPEVRLVAILRDPVERARSHHRMLVMRGEERRSFDDAIADLLRPEELERARSRPQDRTGYITRGEYGRILAGYFDVFPAQQIQVVFTDELERAPAQLLRRIHEFIGVNADFQPDNLGSRYRTGATVRGFSWRSPSSWTSPSAPFSPQRVARAFAHNSAAQAMWHALGDASQRRVMRSYSRIAPRVARRNRGRPPNDVRANAEPSPATLARLREHYQQDACQLAALLGVAPTWQAPVTESARQ